MGDASGAGPTLRVNWRPEVGRWYHLAYTFNDEANTQALYVDGETAGSGAAATRSIVYDDHDLLVGAESERGTINYFFRGNVDEIRLWSIARTAGEIRATRNLRLAGTEAGLQGYWRFDEGRGSTTADLSGKAGLANFIGSPDWVPAAGSFNRASVLGQYRLRVEIQDNSGPLVTGTTLAEEGSIESRLISRFQVSFSEELEPGFTTLNRTVFARNGHGYMLTAEPMSWPAAQELAASLGGYLVVVNDRAENDWIRQTFNNGANLNLWLGFTDQVKEGQWVWEAGQVSSFTAWSGGEPNNNGDEDYASMYPNGLWNDVTRYTSYRAVIEFDGPDADRDGIPDSIDPAADSALNHLDLRAAGRDGAFDTSDDEVYLLAPADYSGGLTVDLLLVNGPLLPGSYRFTATSALRDRSGNALSAPFVRHFTVAAQRDAVTEPRANDNFAQAGQLGTGENGFGTYRLSEPLGARTSPYFMAPADFNKDGLADLAVACYGASVVQVFLGTSAGSFEPHESYSVPANPTDVKVGDFNKDGRLDLAVTGHSAARVSILFGTADGSFSAATSYNSGATPYRLAPGDFDGDGHLDIASVNQSGRGVSVYFGSAAGTLSGPTNLTFTGTGRGIAADDLNSDGRTDLIYVTESTAQRFVSLGKADRSFETRAPVNLPGDGRAVVLADMDNKAGDEIVIVTANSRGLVFSTDAAGNLNEIANFAINLPNTSLDPYDVTAVDLDGDGRKDLAVASSGIDRVSIVRQAGPLQFGTPIYYTVAGGPVGIVPGDFDKNGAVDLVVSVFRSSALVTLSGFFEKTLAEDPTIPGVRVGGGRGTLTSRSDTDFWSFYARAGESIQVAFRSTGAGATLYGTLYGPSYDTLAGFNASAGNITDSGMRVAAVSGTYFVAINSTTEFTGDYTLRATVVAPPIVMEDESNSPINNATPLSFRQEGDSSRASAFGYVPNGNDLDYYALGNLPAGSTVYLSARLASGPNPLIPVVALYDASGYVPEVEGGQVFDSVGEVRVQRAGAYYALVRGGGASSGLMAQYALEVTTIPTGSLSFANLQVASINLPAITQVLSGRPINVTYRVRNNGASPTVVGNWLDRITLSANEIPGDNDDIILGSFQHSGALAPQASYDATQTVTIPDGFEGTYYIIVATDSGQQVSEFLFEADNFRASEARLTVTLPNYPDLLVEDLSASFQETGPIQVTWRTANRGNGGAGKQFRERLVVRNLGTGTILLTQEFTRDPLAAGAFFERSFSLARPIAGRYEVTVQTDSGDDLFELNSAGHLAAELNSFATTFNPILVNRPPTVAQVTDRQMAEDGTLNVPLTVDDGETGPGSVFLTVSSSNEALVPAPLISVQGTGGSRTLIIRPAPNLNGRTVISVVASDGALSSKMSFGLQVNPVNDPPTISRISAVELEEDKSSGPIPFTVNDPESESSELKISAQTSNPQLLPIASIGFIGSDNARAIVIKPEANRFGQATVTLQVSDAEQTATSAFIVTVLAVNDPPVISPIADIATRPGAAISGIAFEIGDVESGPGSLAIIKDSSNKALVPLDNIQITGSGATRSLTITPVGNEPGAARITIGVTDADGGTASETFNLLVSNDALVITTHPESQIVSEGTRAEFSVKTLPETGNTYQWFFNAAPIGGATSPSLVINSARLADSGSYYVEVSGRGATVASREAKLRVVRGIVIDTQPQSLPNVKPGSTVSFSVRASGPEPLNYQWFFGQNLIPNATSPTLVIPDVRSAFAGSYSVRISSPLLNAPVVSAPASLTLAESLRIVSEPEDLIVKLGDPISLSVETLGSAAATYQWYFRGGEIPERTPSITRAAATLAHAGEYRLEIRTPGGSLLSRSIRVIVVAPPVILKQPLPQSVAVGRSTKLGVVASGTEPLTFEWFKDNVSIGTTPGPVLELLNVTPQAQGDYKVLVSNIAGQIESASVRVSIIEGVQITVGPESQVRGVGETVNFNVQATGTGLNYRWYYRGVPIPGATGPSFSIADAEISDSGSYAVEVSNAAGAVRSADASLRVVAPPVVTRQPQGQNALLGGGARFSVAVSGSEPLTIQWTLNGVAIPDATAPVLILQNLQVVQEGDYRAEVRNAAGTVLSEAATLRVFRGAQITTQPLGGTVRGGETFNLSVVATGSEPLQYQWQRNGFNIPGETRATYAATLQGSYTVRVSNPAGSEMSLPAVVRVIQPVRFRVQPVAVSLKGGESSVLKVVAEGTGPLTYQWQRDGVDIPGATSDTLIIQNVRNAGDYRVLVSNEIGSEMSQVARISLIDPPTIVTGPLSQVLTLGANLTLSVQATGAQPLTYQWSVNGVAIAGATGPTFSLNNIGPTNAGNYSVSVANPGGVVSSSLASIALNIPTLVLADNRANAPASSEPLAAYSSSNATATRETGEPNHAGNQPAEASVWMRWTAPFSGVVYFTTAGSSFDTILAAYTLNAQSQLQQIASNEDGAPFKTSIIEINAVRGTTYFIAVDGYKGATGNIVLSWLLQQKQPRLPRITRQPVGFTQLIGRAATFSVQAEAADTSGLSYQWFHNTQLLAGQTSSTLTLNNVQIENVGRYWVRVSNAGDSTFFIISDFAPLIVNLVETQREGPDINTSDKPDASNVPLAPQRIGNRSIRLLQAPARGYTGSQVFSTVGAVRDENEPNHCNASGGASAWSLYEAPATGSLLVTTDGSLFDTVVAIYSGVDDFASMVLLGCDNNSGADGQDSRIVVPVIGGQFYFIVVDGVSGASGIAQLNYTLSLPPVITQQPGLQGNQGQALSQSVAEGANITLRVTATNLANATQTYQWSFNGTNITSATNATHAINPVTPAHAGQYMVTVANFAGQTQSQTFTLEVLSPVTVVTAPQNQTNAVGGSVVFSVAANGTGPLLYQWLFGDTPIPGQTSAAMSLNNIQIAQAGTYRVRVSNAANALTNSATLTILEPVSITQQPANASVSVGGSATFNVTAAGSPVIGYQWRFNGVNIAGQTGPALQVQNLRAQDAGSYSVLVSNSVSSVVSSDATLSVLTPVAIVQHPRDQTISGATTTEFEVITSGSEPITYQWRFNGSPIVGATSRVLLLTNLAPVNAGTYSVVVSNGGGPVISSNAVLTLTAPPTITVQPVSQSVNVGAPVSFSVTAAGSGALNYQWRFNGVVLPGRTAANLLLPGVTPAEAGDYTVAIDNPVGSIVSQPATLSVNTPVNILQHPASASALEGSTVSFSVLATGSNPILFQWLRNDVPVANATNDTLTLTNIVLADAASYRVQVSNGAGTTNSSVAALTVRAVPRITTQPSSVIVNNGSPANFTVVASGSAPLTYQWHFNGVPMALQTAATLQITAAGLANEGDYTVQISNDAGTITSGIAELAINRGEQLALSVSREGNQMVIRISGPVGGEINVERSINLQAWTLTDTLSLDGGTAEHREVIGATGFGFYRAVLNP